MISDAVSVTLNKFLLEIQSVTTNVFYLKICRRLFTMGQFFEIWNFGTKLLQLQFFILDLRL